MSIDTLYLDNRQEPCGIIPFLDRLIPVEAGSLQNIAIGGVPVDYEEDEIKESFKGIGTCLETLDGLKTIYTVQNIHPTMCSLAYVSDDEDAILDSDLLRSLHETLRRRGKRVLKLYDRFPSELHVLARAARNWSVEELPCPVNSNNEEVLEGFNNSEWLEQRMKHVWGWWRPVNPAH
jgi:hypothetical protein